MSQAETLQEVVISHPMNDHRTITVEVESTNATRHIVEYATTELEGTLRSLPTGTTIPLAAEPIGTRGNAWRAVSLGR